MSSNGEVIHLHVGQAGVQIANACWELYCLEHGINSHGYMCDNQIDDSFRTFFACSSSQKVVPRLVMVDSEPTVIDEIRCGTYGHLFKPETLITGKEDCGNNFARGYCTIGAELIEMTMNAIRCVAESCSSLQGFMAFRSIGGGTGSGLGNLILERITDEYGKITKIDCIVVPSASISPLTTEPYNGVLATHFAMEYSDCTFIFDNQALYDICDKKLDVPNPTYTNLNRIIGQSISAMTASLRFDGSANVAFPDFKTNLVPFPRIHFLLVSYAPLVTMYNSCYTELNTENLTMECFQPANQLARCTPSDGKYMSSVLLYRGNVAAGDVNQSINTLKERGDMEFVDWSPTGFKLGINAMPPCPVPGGDIGATDRAVIALSNNTIISKVFCQMLTKYETLYARKAFMHHFLSEGLDECTFKEAADDLCALMQDYAEVEGPACSCKRRCAKHAAETDETGSRDNEYKWETGSSHRSSHRSSLRSPILSPAPSAAPSIAPSAFLTTHEHNHHSGLHEPIHHSRVHDPNHHSGLHEPNHHSGLHEPNHHSGLHEPNHHSGLHEPNHHSGLHEPNHHSGLHEPNHHSGLHEPNHHSGLHEPNHHSGLHEPNHHSGLHEPNHHSGLHEPNHHSGLHDNEAKLRSEHPKCICTCTCHAIEEHLSSRSNENHPDSRKDTLISGCWQCRIGAPKLSSTSSSDKSAHKVIDSSNPRKTTQVLGKSGDTTGDSGQVSKVHGKNQHNQHQHATRKVLNELNAVNRFLDLIEMKCLIKTNAVPKKGTTNETVVRNEKHLFKGDIIWHIPTYSQIKKPSRKRSRSSRKRSRSRPIKHYSSKRARRKSYSPSERIERDNLVPLKQSNGNTNEPQRSLKTQNNNTDGNRIIQSSKAPHMNKYDANAKTKSELFLITTHNIAKPPSHLHQQAVTVDNYFGRSESVLKSSSPTRSHHSQPAICTDSMTIGDPIHCVSETVLSITDTQSDRSISDLRSKTARTKKYASHDPNGSRAVPESSNKLIHEIHDRTTLDRQTKTYESCDQEHLISRSKIYNKKYLAQTLNTSTLHEPRKIIPKNLDPKRHGFRKGKRGNKQLMADNSKAKAILKTAPSDTQLSKRKHFNEDQDLPKLFQDPKQNSLRKDKLGEKQLMADNLKAKAILKTAPSDTQLSKRKHFNEGQVLPKQIQKKLDERNTNPEKCELSSTDIDERSSVNASKSMNSFKMFPELRSTFSGGDALPSTSKSCQKFNADLLLKPPQPIVTCFMVGLDAQYNNNNTKRLCGGLKDSHDEDNGLASSISILKKSSKTNKVGKSEGSYKHGNSNVIQPVPQTSVTHFNKYDHPSSSLKTVHHNLDKLSTSKSFVVIDPNGIHSAPNKGPFNSIAPHNPMLESDFGDARILKHKLHDEKRPKILIDNDHVSRSEKIKQSEPDFEGKYSETDKHYNENQKPKSVINSDHVCPPSKSERSKRDLEDTRSKKYEQKKSKTMIDTKNVSRSSKLDRCLYFDIDDHEVSTSTRSQKSNSKHSDTKNNLRKPSPYSNVHISRSEVHICSNNLNKIEVSVDRLYTTDHASQKNSRLLKLTRTEVFTWNNKTETDSKFKISSNTNQNTLTSAEDQSHISPELRLSRTEVVTINTHGAENELFAKTEDSHTHITDHASDLEHSIHASRKSSRSSIPEQLIKEHRVPRNNMDSYGLPSTSEFSKQIAYRNQIDSEELFQKKVIYQQIPSRSSISSGCAVNTTSGFSQQSFDSKNGVKRSSKVNRSIKAHYIGNTNARNRTSDIVLMRQHMALRRKYKIMTRIPRTRQLTRKELRRTPYHSNDFGQHGWPETISQTNMILDPKSQNVQWNSMGNKNSSETEA